MKTVLLAAIVGLVGSPLTAATQAQSQQPVTIDKAYVYITGAVNKPGKYLLTEKLTVLALIQQAGGLAPSAGAGDRITIISGTQKDPGGVPVVRKASYKEMLAATPEKPVAPLGPGDQVLVGGS